ncbi:MAG: ATP-dependent helicase [Candidatus Sericytochromatia bacterium]|nr:ATP-dependent helicase [Candidatus Sericytochromatia bacterium]
MTSYTLTEEQQAVVAHDHGPALVFAVAGAGKTTAMVHRIERLVRAGVFAPRRILASSFNKSAVEELKRRLQQWPHCQQVQCQTLHGIGWRVLKQAIARGAYHEHTQLPSDEHVSSQIYGLALKQARQQPALNRQLEHLDREDFLDYVSRCKGNLRFADLAKMELPEGALQWARQAEAPPNLPHYLTLYRLFEEVRLAHKLLTFDDLLSEAWVCFWRYPSLLKACSQQYDCILVDEFQDVNLAQSEMLDLLSQPHRNYMAIGDDDQTIYTWRGASPEFILNFCQRYQAQEYLLSENFRSRASQIVLANAVIHQNRHRREKRLQLTQGFGGQSSLIQCSDNQAMAEEACALLVAARDQGMPLQEMVVLVRNWSQTPLIEHRLLQLNLPYVIPGKQYFFNRPEIRDLLNYVDLAHWNTLLEQGQLLSADASRRLLKAWNRVYKRPNRYITTELSQQVMTRVLGDNTSLTRALRLEAAQCAKEYLSDHLLRLSGVLSQLSRAWLEQLPAQKALQELVQALDYTGWLQRQSAVPQIGQDKADGIQAFLDFSASQPHLPALLQELDRLSQNQRDQDQRQESNVITVSTIHGAKGLEWDLVVVPGCQNGILPARTQEAAALEDDCRLFYVAITRARQALHLLYCDNQSQFLLQARAADRLRQVLQLSGMLQAGAEGENPAWRWASLPQLLNLIHELGLASYFKTWASRNGSLAEGLLQRLRAWIGWQQRERPEASLPPSAACFEGDASLLTEAEAAELKALYLDRPALKPGQVRHSHYGLGSILSRSSNGPERTVTVKFFQHGKVALPLNDPALEWGPPAE